MSGGKQMMNYLSRHDAPRSESTVTAADPLVGHCAMPQFGEASPLDIIEAQSLPFEPRLEDAILFSQERADVVLLVPKAHRTTSRPETGTETRPKSTSASLDPVLGQYALY
jgi:hypothetical protein